MKTQTDPRGHTTTFDYDALGRKTRTTLPIVDGIAAQTATQYDAVGNVRFQTNARQQTTEYRYNELNQRTDQIDPIDCAEEGAANAPKASEPAKMSNAGTSRGADTARGLIAAFVGTARRFIIAITAATAPIAISAQNAIGPSSSAAPAAASVATTSQPLAAIATQQKAGSATCTQSWTYDTENNVLTHTDRRGITTTNRYDGENRLLQQDRAGLTLQTLVRDAQGNVRTQTDALQRVTTFTYDKANRKTREDRSGIATEAWTHTPLGDVATHTDADARTTVYTYTPRRFLESESLAGETTRYTYDGTGHRLTRQRPTGEATTWTYTYDAAGNLRRVTDPLAHTTTFVHDENNNRTQIIDANERITAFAYDERNRLKGKTYPGGARWIWRHDGDDNRIHSEAPNGRVTGTDYDALNRPTVATYLGAPTNEVASTTRTYDGNGNITSIVEATSSGLRTESRDYDDFDRLTHAVDGDGRHAGYRYDDAGNRTHLIDHDGRETVWTYDALNHNTRVFVPGMGATVMTYTPAGLPDTIVRPDGSLTEHDYLDNGRLQAIRHSRNGTTLASYTYVYDPNGNRTEQRETNGATTANTTQSTRYRYDDADRLTEVDEPGRLTTYTLDPVGNRSVEHVVDGSNATLSHSILDYNDRDQLTARDDAIANVHVSQTWDANGNLETQTVNGQPPRTYTYDARDRLIAMTNPGAPNGQTPLTFAYHADGLRREKSTPTTTTRYQYDGHSLLAETNTLGNTRRQFHYSATQLIAQTQAGTSPTHRHVLLDALRSPIALLDTTGTVTARTSYDAFGEIRAQQATSGQLTTPNREAPNAELVIADDQPVGFTGYLKDPESGLYYAKARYYDPTTARFTSEDPEAGKDMEPPSLHRYLYAYANPTFYTDRSGRCGNPAMSDDAYCRQLQYEQDALIIGADLDSTEGMRATYDYQIGKSEGRASGAWQAIKDFGQFAADIPGTIIDFVPGVDVGSLERMRGRTTNAIEFFTSPIKITAQGLDNYSTAFAGAVENKNYRGAGQLYGSVEGSITANAALSYFTPALASRLPLPSRYAGLKPSTASASTTERLVAVEGANGRPAVAAAITPEVVGQASAPPKIPYLFRGTSAGYPGSPGLQRIGITPASTDPVVSTLFATESENFGQGVLHIASPDDLKGIDIDTGNVLAGKEAEVGVGVSPLEFERRASTTISASKARSHLREMGIDLPEKIYDKAGLESDIQTSPRLNPDQIQEFIKRANHQ